MASTFLKKKHNRADLMERSRQFLDQWALFLRQFVKHPGMIGSVIPSSPMLVDNLLDGVDWDRTRLFVEFGPGVGTFTRPILERLHPDATLLAIDLNADFVAYLESRIADPRLRVVHGSAVDVTRHVRESGHEQADYVVSGIPFSTLPDGVGDAVCAATQSVLKPGGAFLVYQYSAYVRSLLMPRFARIDERIEWLNIPPCRTFRAVSGEMPAGRA
ncbi:MAG: class I SAM-dependent methyltransferase [Sphingobium sp.]